MTRQEMIAAARGDARAELVFKRATVIDVFNRRLFVGDVAVSGGVILGVGKYAGAREIDCTGRYLLPGLTDAHVHIESSMLTPAQYAAAVVPHGVTTIIADPHEIVNVCGERGLVFMLDSAKTVPLRIHFMMPSCVPAAPLGTPGQVIDLNQTKRMLGHYPLLGLGEMMNYVGVVRGDSEALDKMALTDIVDGHAPGLRGEALNAYALAGAIDDHECASVGEALEKIAAGMHVLIREGTGAKQLRALLPAVNAANLNRFAFCTDDRSALDITREGTIDHCVRLAVALGMSAADAVCIAAFNAPRLFGLGRFGAIAPGYAADLLVCTGAAAERVEQVYIAGELVAEDGRALFEAGRVEDALVRRTVHLPALACGMLIEPFDAVRPVIAVRPGDLLTDKVYCQTGDGLAYAAVIERHHGTGRIGKCRIQNLPIQGGALAQSIGHDTHNVTVLGDNEGDMLKAVRALGVDGGIVVVKGGAVLAKLDLPIAGLIADGTLTQVCEADERVARAAAQICPGNASQAIMLMSFLSLPVIPDIKLTDMGLVDVKAQIYL